MPKTLELKISRVTDFSAPFGNGEAGMGAGCSFTLLNPVTEEQWGYKFNLTFTSGSYVLSDCINLGTGQTVTFPYSYTDEPLHSMTLETSSTYYTVTVEFPDSFFLCNCIGLVASLPASGGSSSAPVDLAPVLQDLALIKTSLTSVSSSILTPVLAQLDLVKNSVASVSSSISALDFSGVDFSALANFTLPADLTPIDITNLDGHFSKFVSGDVVFFGLYGLWEIVSCSLIMTSEDTYEPHYQVRQNTTVAPATPKYRYNTVPQSVLSLFTAFAPVVGSTTQILE